MTPPAARIAIIGGGLSGLYAAWLLERCGMPDYVVLEARETLGGRILSASASGQSASETSTANSIDRFDLGPTWFWPEFQRELSQLVDSLGLQRFEQFEAGDMMVERSADAPPARVHGYVNSPPSVRLIGGMGALVGALRRTLNPARIQTGQTVRTVRSTTSHVELHCEDAAGHVTTWRANHVLLALPPRLAENTIAFEPPLPQTLADDWRATATWMAPHAKYIAIYETAFWREQGLSGEARSARGPLGEIHDASMPGGSAALFGFFGVPPHVRNGRAEAEWRTQCREQLVRLFGPHAANPRAEFIKDWALDRYTATAGDLDATGDHGQAPASTAASGPWRGRLTGIASEWSPHFPGYLAGAIQAAGLGFQSLAPPVVPTARDDEGTSSRQD